MRLDNKHIGGVLRDILGLLITLISKSSIKGCYLLCFTMPLKYDIDSV